MVEGSPQLEDGYVKIANELFEAIAFFDFSKREYKVICAIIRQTYGWRKKEDRIALSQFEEMTGLKKNHISTTMAGLIKRKIVLKRDQKISINKYYDEWELPGISPKTGLKNKSQNGTKNSPKLGLVPKQEPEEISPILGADESQNGKKSSPKTVTTKDNKNTIQKTNTSMSILDDETEPEEKPKRVIVPYKKIVDLYHRVLPELPKIIELTTTRKGYISARWSDQLPDLETWENYFNFVRGSDFLMGKTDPAPGRRKFIANLEWLTKSSNYAKIVERQYHSNGGRRNG